MKRTINVKVIYSGIDIDFTEFCKKELGSKYDETIAKLRQLDKYDL